MLRLLLAILVGKSIFLLTRLFKIGGGSAAPGYYALKIDPDIVKKLAGQIPQQVMITGTNGKTTTARLLSHFVQKQQLKVIRNSTGSNLERGIASALISRSSLAGKIGDIDLGIWEVDEAAFSKTVFQIKPHLIVFLNAYRDQLDRYGEVDTIVKNWRVALEKVNWQPTILLNGGDVHTWSLAKDQDKIYEFRVKNHRMWQESTAKTPTRKHQDDIAAVDLKNRGLAGVDFTLEFDHHRTSVHSKLPGIYHVYDLLAAFGAYYLLNLPTNNFEELLEGYSPAFGRVEKLLLDNREAYIFLIKNPAGATQVFETLTAEIKENNTLLLALNDNFADGTDVSWIWDADFEEFRIKDLKCKIICSGTRAADMALRVKYAGGDAKNLSVISDLANALAEARSIKEGRIFILPTYTALLELERLLAKLGVKKEYWQEN